MKYLAKTREVDAIRWTGNNKEEVEKFFNGEVKLEWDEEYRRWIFPLITGFHEYAPVWRWIVRMGAGSFKSFSDDEFNRLYELPGSDIVGYDVSGTHMMPNHAGRLEVPTCCRKTYQVSSCREAVNQFFADFPDACYLNFAYPVNAEGKHVL